MASNVCKPQQRFFSGDGDHLVDALVEACASIRSKPQLPSYGRELVPALDTGYFGVILDVQDTSSEHNRLHSRPTSTGSPTRKPSGKKPRSQVQPSSIQLQCGQSSSSPTSCSSEQSILSFFPGTVSMAAPAIKSQSPKQKDAKLTKQDAKQVKAQAISNIKPSQDTGSSTPPLAHFQSANNSRNASGKRFDASVIIVAACPAFLSPAPRPDQLPMPPSLLLRKAAAQAAARAASTSPTQLPSTPLCSEPCDWSVPCILQILPAVMA